MTARTPSRPAPAAPPRLQRLRLRLMGIVMTMGTTTTTRVGRPAGQHQALHPWCSGHSSRCALWQQPAQVFRQEASTRARRQEGQSRTPASLEFASACLSTRPQPLPYSNSSVFCYFDEGAQREILNALGLGPAPCTKVACMFYGDLGRYLETYRHRAGASTSQWLATATLAGWVLAASM